MLLARRGYHVLVVDQASFPSDTLSTHAVKIPAVASLQKWGLHERVAASNCPPMPRNSLDVGPFALVGSAPAYDGVDVGYAPRRRVLDTILVEAAAQAGADIRTSFSVDEILLEGDQVVGIRGRTATGASVEERAPITIGADGRHSLVAKTVDAPTYAEHPILTCAYFSYFSGVPMVGPELYVRPGCMLVSFPTNDGLTLVLAEWPRERFDEIRADIEGHFNAAVNLAPSLAERVNAGRREERFYGTGDLPNYLRKPGGPGWALVGDAGMHRDPITAQGIVDAFRDAELLADAVDAGLSGREPMQAALDDYEQKRNAATLPIYEFTCQLASLQPPPPEMQQLFGACLGNQDATDRLLGVVEGTVPVQEFFAPENVGAIMAARV